MFGDLGLSGLGVCNLGIMENFEVCDLGIMENFGVCDLGIKKNLGIMEISLLCVVCLASHGY